MVWSVHSCWFPSISKSWPWHELQYRGWNTRGRNFRNDAKRKFKQILYIDVWNIPNQMRGSKNKWCISPSLGIRIPLLKCPSGSRGEMAKTSEDMVTWAVCQKQMERPCNLPMKKWIFEIKMVLWNSLRTWNLALQQLDRPQVRCQWHPPILCWWGSPWFLARHRGFCAPRGGKHATNLWFQIGLLPLGWLMGHFAGNHGFHHQIWLYPVNVPKVPYHEHISCARWRLAAWRTWECRKRNSMADIKDVQKAMA